MMHHAPVLLHRSIVFRSRMGLPKSGWIESRLSLHKSMGCGLFISTDITGWSWTLLQHKWRSSTTLPSSATSKKLFWSTLSDIANPPLPKRVNFPSQLSPFPVLHRNTFAFATFPPPFSTSTGPLLRETVLNPTKSVLGSERIALRIK